MRIPFQGPYNPYPHSLPALGILGRFDEHTYCLPPASPECEGTGLYMRFAAARAASMSMSVFTYTWTTFHGCLGSGFAMRVNHVQSEKKLYISTLVFCLEVVHIRKVHEACELFRNPAQAPSMGVADLS